MSRAIGAALAGVLLVLLRASGDVAAAEPGPPALIGQACSRSQPGTVTVAFAWPPTPGALEVWLDLSLVDNGFQPGTFAAAGPLAAVTNVYRWDGLRPGLVHHYRVNVRDSSGWRIRAAGSFVSGDCQLGAASLRGTRQACSDAIPGRVRVTFSWAPALASQGQQWLDLSLQDGGFAPGSFLAVGPLPADASSYAWDGLVPGARHYWRVNSLAADGWRSSAAGSFTTLTCSSPSGATAVDEGLAALREQLRASISAVSFDAAVAVTDLQTGETIDVGGDTLRLPGCAINFFVLLSVVRDLEMGRYAEALVGDLIARTVWSSNPHTARQLLIITGLGSLAAGVVKVNDLLDELGLDTSFYDHAPAYPSEFSLAGRANVVTANEMNRALTSFYQGAVVGVRWRDYLLDKMTGVKPGLQYLIPAGVGQAVVSHKNGFFWSPGGWVDNDIGIVVFSSGGVNYAYAVSFFTQRVPTEYGDIPLGQEVSRLIWQYFRARYP